MGHPPRPSWRERTTPLRGCPISISTTFSAIGTFQATADFLRCLPTPSLNPCPDLTRKRLRKMGTVRNVQDPTRPTLQLLRLRLSLTSPSRQLPTTRHLPRLRPHDHDLQLPGLRHLSLGQHTPLLAPMEPQADGSYSHVEPPRHTGPSIADIVTGSQRKLPVPQLPKVHEMLHLPNGLSSGESSAAASINGDSHR